MFMLAAVLFAVVAAVQANAVLSTTRAGKLNTYYLYQNPDQNNLENIPANLESDDDHPFVDSTLQTIVLVHGANGNYLTDLNPLVKTEILRNNDANVIVVDWSAYSQMSYSNAVAAVPDVGWMLADFLIRLQTHDDKLISFDNLHLVGFDLGAHVVGYAGRVVQSLTNGESEVVRITGLDPAKSQWGSSSGRLTKTDATYVEVIHTDGDGIFSNGLGTAIGDVDFFVNGGSNQPGCLTHSCSHNRAYQLFAGTFARTEKLNGNLCNSNLQLTLNTCRSQTLHIGQHDVEDKLNKDRTDGTYRVNTGRVYPY